MAVSRRVVGCARIAHLRARRDDHAAGGHVVAVRRIALRLDVVADVVQPERRADRVARRIWPLHGGAALAISGDRSWRDRPWNVECAVSADCLMPIRVATSRGWSP